MSALTILEAQRKQMLARYQELLRLRREADQLTYEFQRKRTASGSVSKRGSSKKGNLGGADPPSRDSANRTR
jgi:hypothetical protein